MSKYIDRYARCPECGGLRPKDENDPALREETRHENSNAIPETYMLENYNPSEADFEEYDTNYISDINPQNDICVADRSCPSGYVSYTVVAGDTFAGIARRYGLSTMQLWRANPCVDPQNITPGLVLCVPATPPAPTPTPLPTPTPTPTPVPVPVPPTTCPTNYRQHTIVAGETYVDIMIRYDVSYNALRAANRSIDITRLEAGKTLCVPPSGTRGVCDTNRSHIIETNETLMMIATRFSTTIAELFRLNPSLTPRDFTPGRVICIPAQK